MAIKQRFIYCPAQASYSASDSAASYKRVQLDGGAGRYRRDIIGVSRLVDVQWAVEAPAYYYIEAFYRSFCARPQPFMIMLAIDGLPLADCEAWFMPGSYSLSAKQGGIYTISAQLEVIPPPRNAALDDWLISLASYFGPGWEEYASRLHQIVNYSLPGVMPYPPVPFPKVKP